MSFKYKAFISYSHDDEKWANWLQPRLERYRVPARIGKSTATADIEKSKPDRLYPIFRDRSELASSSDLSQAIEVALQQSEAMIVICSPAAAASRWVNEEIKRFKSLGRGDRIHCLVVDGDLTPGAKENPFPPALLTDETGAKTLEPLAADVRKMADGPRGALQKIVAGLLGVGIDDLVQRETQRQVRRWSMVAATAVTISAVTIGLAIFAFAAREEAQIRRGQAEDLIGFMLTDLRGRLEPIGRLDVLDDVATQAIAYYDTISNDDYNDQGLSSKAMAMRQIGEVRMFQGQLEESRPQFMEALAINELLAAENPDDADRLFELGQDQFWVGYYFWESGDYENAEHHFTAYLDTSLKLAALEPDQRRSAEEVVYAYSNLGSLENARRRWPESRSSFELAARQLENMYAGAEHDAFYVRQMADIQSWLGSTTMEIGDLTAAIAYFEKVVDLLESFPVQEEDMGLEAEIAEAQQFVGAAYLSAGKLDLARSAVADSVARYARLVERDVENIRWRMQYSAAVHHEALVSFELEDHDDARNKIRQAQAVAAAVADATDDPRILARAAIVELAHARLALSWQDIEVARSSVDASLSLLDSDVFQSDQIRSTLAEAYTLAGRLESSDSAAEPMLARAEQLLRQVTETTNHPDRLYLLAQVLTCQGRVGEVTSISDSLAEQGYSRQRLRQLSC